MRGGLMTRGSTVQVPIITTPDLGEMSAKFMCEQLGVKSQKDTEKLKEVRGHLITHTCLISHEDTEEEVRGNSISTQRMATSRIAGSRTRRRTTSCTTRASTRA